VRRRLILITSIYYWPETFANAPYVTGLASHLAAQGDEVVVVTGQPHYPEWQTRFRRSEEHDGVRLRRRWHYVPSRQSAVRRALYEASFLASGLTALGLTRRPDAIIGVSPTLSGAVLARTAASLYARPYGLVFQDLIGQAAEQSELPGARRHAGSARRLELRLARNAEAVAVISAGFRTYLEQGGVASNRIHLVRNWTQVREATFEPRELTRARHGWGSQEFVALHSGNMGYKQGLDNVLEAARRLEGGAIHVVFAGAGSEQRRLQRRSQELGLTNVSFLPVQPSGEYESMLRAADVLLVNQRASVTDMSLPSRLTSYFAAGRPVIAAVADKSETRREIVASRAGKVVAADDPDALASALTSLSQEPEERRQLGTAAREYAEQALDAETALAKYEAFVDRILDLQ
jgi:glycosyltransferase involved in cell wall biosynthesis